MASISRSIFFWNWDILYEYFKTKSSSYTVKSRALSMVKLAMVDGRDCVKITDDQSKVQWTDKFLPTILTYTLSEHRRQCTGRVCEEVYLPNLCKGTASTRRRSEV